MYNWSLNRSNIHSIIIFIFLWIGAYLHPYIFELSRGQAGRELQTLNNPSLIHHVHRVPGEHLFTLLTINFMCSGLLSFSYTIDLDIDENKGYQACGAVLTFLEAQSTSPINFVWHFKIYCFALLPLDKKRWLCPSSNLMTLLNITIRYTCSEKHPFSSVWAM